MTAASAARPILVAFTLVFGACALPEAEAPAPSPVGGRSVGGNEVSTSSAPTGSVADTSATSPPGGAAIAGLVVAPESAGADYDRTLFSEGVDADGDGCDTRCEVLESQRRTDLDGLTEGGWLSIYDGYTTPDPDELEVDHVVALAEAWRSGADAWDESQRRRFANDPANLVAVTAATNRSKGDRGPASWQPPAPESWCRFATTWVNLKVHYRLTADADEKAALERMLIGC